MTDNVVRLKVTMCRTIAIQQPNVIEWSFRDIPLNVIVVDFVNKRIAIVPFYTQAMIAHYTS